MDSTVLPYLAGAMDSDGYFTIRRSTYHRRVRKDAVNAVYSERAGLKQVSPHIPELLRDTFGGGFALTKGSTENSRPLYSWNATDLVAAKAVDALLPHLRVKRQQAETLRELRQWKKNSDAHHLAWWWTREHPDWQQMPMLTTIEVASILGYASPSLTSQALSNGTLIALPRVRNSHTHLARFPEPFVRELAILYQHHKYVTPPQLIVQYEKLFDTVRMMNQIGTGEHPVTFRRGVYAPLE